MKIIKQVNESLDNPNLSEDISSDELFDKITMFISDELFSVVEDMDRKVEENISSYNTEWFNSRNSSEIGHALLTAAELMAEDFLRDAPDTIEESLLQEKKWRHQLSVGGRLRQAIEDADYDLIKELLIAAYKEIHEVDPENFDEDDLDRAIDDVEILDTEPDEEIDVDEYEIEGNFDYELNNLYDLCDGLDIWIPLEESLNLTEADLNPNIKKEIKRAYKSFDASQDWDRKAKRKIKREVRQQAIKDIPDRAERKRVIKDDDEIIDDVYPTNKKFVAPSRGKNVETADYPFYVTYYSEYPIYEPAEGGYYYAGANARYSKGFQTREEAQAHLRELAEEEDMDIVNDDYAQINTPYIGEQDHIVVETRKSYLSGEKGYVPYS